jgi:antitoxin component YwqK of YwqJK toxin-antitoxin module
MIKNASIIFISVIFICLYSCKMHDQTYKYYDLNGQRISEREFYNNGENGRVEIKFMGENGRKLRELVEFRGGKENGKCIRWDERDNFKLKEGEYKDGKQHGTWIFWYRDGSNDIEEYKEGKKHGKATNYDWNGRQHGRSLMWDEKGNLIFEEIWDGGKLVKKIK